MTIQKHIERLERDCELMRREVNRQIKLKNKHDYLDLIHGIEDRIMALRQMQK